MATQNITSNGTLHFQAQNASTDGATVTNNLWTFNGATTTGTTFKGTTSLVAGSTNTITLDGANSVTSIALETSGASLRVLNSAESTWNIPVSALSFWMTSAGVVAWASSNNPESPDTGISRCAAKVVCVGGGTSGDTTGSIQGVTTNSSACAGCIGEEREFSVASTGAVVTVSSNTIIVAVSSGASVVAAGDYDATGISCFSSAAATSFTSFMQGFSTAGAVQGALGTYSAESFAAEVPGTITLGTTTNELCKVLPRTRISLASAGNVSMWVRPVFSVSGTISAYGQIMLRRIR